jgi:hypothetical protein
MKCPQCQFENPEDANFCLECGQKFEQKCLQCEKSLPVGAKSCNMCGHQLSEKPVPQPPKLPFDEKLDRIQHYLPKCLTEKIYLKESGLKVSASRFLLTITQVTNQAKEDGYEFKRVFIYESGEGNFRAWGGR